MGMIPKFEAHLLKFIQSFENQLSNKNFNGLLSFSLPLLSVLVRPLQIHKYRLWNPIFSIKIQTKTQKNHMRGLQVFGLVFKAKYLKNADTIYIWSKFYG